MKHNQPTLTDEVTLTMRGLCHKRAICMYRVLENAEAEGMDPAFLWKSLREYGYDTGKNIEKAMEDLRRKYAEAVLLSFPGDELAMGGCMAAGREFFHINSHGGAEPCPFSPYSDVNIRDTSLRAAIASPLFRRLQNEGVLSGEHVGGCVLYERRDRVAAMAGAAATA